MAAAPPGSARRTTPPLVASQGQRARRSVRNNGVRWRPQLTKQTGQQGDAGPFQHVRDPGDALPVPAVYTAPEALRPEALHYRFAGQAEVLYRPDFKTPTSQIRSVEKPLNRQGGIGVIGRNSLLLEVL